MRKSECGFSIKARTENDATKIRQLFMNERGLGEYMMETEPQVWSTMTDEGYEPANGEEYETECLLIWYETTVEILKGEGIKFSASLYGLNC